MNLSVRSVVDRYLSVVLVKDINADAGWRSENVIGRLIETAGHISYGDGAGGNSNGQMIYQMQFVIDQPVTPFLRWCCKAMELLRDASPKQHDALVAYVYYAKRPNAEKGTDYHTHEDIANECGMSRSAYIQNLNKAQQYISNLMELRSIENNLQQIE